MLKRYVLTVQHEIIVIADSKRTAKSQVLTNDFLRRDTKNLRCVICDELPSLEDELFYREKA